eukprot:60536_1
MNLYLFVSVYALIDALEIQHVNIWTNNMDNNDGWIGYNNFNFTLELDKCVTGTCGYTTADNNGPSYIQKSANITLYSSIVFQVDITAYNQEPIDYCEIWYNFDNIAYTKYSAWNHGIYKNVKVNFPESTIAKIIYIRLQVIGNHTSCYWDNTMLRGIRIPVKTFFSNITTDEKLFSKSTNISFSSIYSIYSLIIIISIVPVCCIVIVIIRLICKRIKNRKDSIKYSLSMTTSDEIIHIQNLQRAMMEIMSSLQLSEYDIYSRSYKSKYSNDIITRSISDQRIIALKKGNYTGINNENTLNNSNNTASTANTIHQIYGCSSDDTALERPTHHNYPTVTITPKSSTSQINDAKKSLSLKTLQCLLDELEKEILEQHIDENKYEWFCSTDTIIERETTTETTTETTAETIDWDSRSMHVNINAKYTETFL